MKEIPLTRGMVALVDDADYERVVLEGAWHAHAPYKAYWYAWRTRNGTRPKTLGMHRFIVDAPTGMVVDHINHNGLDNRRANLRLCTVSQNQQNKRSRVGASSRYLGVCKHKYASSFGAPRWAVRVERKHVGLFASEEEAARAYDRVALATFGEFANLNFPEGKSA